MTTNVWEVIGRSRLFANTASVRYIRCASKSGAKIYAGNMIDGPFTARLLDPIPVDVTSYEGSKIYEAEFEKLEETVARQRAEAQEKRKRKA